MKSLYKLSFLFLAIPFAGAAQSADLLQRINLMHTMRRLEFEQKYDSIVYIGTRIPSRDTVYMYAFESWVAKACVMTGDTVKGLKYLQKAIELQQINELGQLKYGYEKFGLDSNKTYQDIVRNFTALSNKHSHHFNRQVLESVLEIYYTDQRVRNVWFTKMGDTAKMNCVDDVMRSTDSMNVVAMNKLLKELGHYPGMSEIGLGLLSNFKHILAHWAGELNRETFVAALKAATLSGQIPNFYGPFILDKIEHYHGRPSIYGEFGSNEDFKDGVFHVREIADIAYVDKRRAEFLLPPLYSKLEVEKCVLPAAYTVQSQKK